MAWGEARCAQFEVLEARLIEARRTHESYTEELEAEIMQTWEPLAVKLGEIKAERAANAHRLADEEALRLESGYVARRARAAALQADKRVLMTPHAQDAVFALCGVTSRGTEIVPFRGGEAFRNIACASYPPAPSVGSRQWHRVTTCRGPRRRRAPRACNGAFWGGCDVGYRRRWAPGARARRQRRRVWQVRAGYARPRRPGNAPKTCALLRATEPTGVAPRPCPG